MIVGSESVTLFLGNFGSGKTEVAVNFALYLRRQRSLTAVVLADLDLVNPYFRSRESLALLTDHGIRVIVPDSRYLHADLPILMPEVRSVLMASTAYIVLDIGGDDVGARVLGSLHDALDVASSRVLMVLNANRPFTGDVAGIARIRGEIEVAARIGVTGFVSNTHLMEETTLATVMSGYETARRAGDAMEIPLEFVCVPRLLVAGVSMRIEEDILPIDRFMAPPWRSPLQGRDNLGRELFKL